MNKITFRNAIKVFPDIETGYSEKESCLPLKHVLKAKYIFPENKY